MISTAITTLKETSMPPRNIPFVIIIALLLPQTVVSQPFLPPPKEPVQDIRGSLVIVGGGTIPDSVYDAFLKLAGGPKARLVVIPTAGVGADDKGVGTYLERWRKMGAASVDLLHARSPVKANDPEFSKSLADATGVWLGGGSQSRLVAAYRGTAVEVELHKLLRRGGVIGGTSAGAAAMSQLMIAGGKVPPELGEGFGFLPGGVIDQHFLKRDRMNRLLDVLSKNPGWFGLGIDEGTAVIVQGRTLTVLGQSYVVACLAAGKDRPASCQVLKTGDKADLITLSRSALARMREP